MGGRKFEVTNQRCSCVSKIRRGRPQKKANKFTSDHNFVDDPADEDDNQREVKSNQVSKSSQIAITT